MPDRCSATSWSISSVAFGLLLEAMIPEQQTPRALSQGSAVAWGSAVEQGSSRGRASGVLACWFLR
eukprot:1109768-Prymnesium_polylepis.1